MSLHYIIDGYNVVKQVSFFKDKKLQDARESFIRFIQVNHLVGSPRNKATVVFDGKGSSGYFDRGLMRQDKHELNYEVRVVFSKNKTADEAISEILAKDSNPTNIVIVSNDKQLKFIARYYRAQSMSVEDLLDKADKSRLDINKGDFSKLSASQQRQINEELSKIWLKEK